MARASGRQVRARIQEQIEGAKKQRKRESRAREQERQFDRQREEIHPAHVLEVLESFAPSEDEKLRLPKATPDPVKEHPAQPLIIRYRNRETDR